MSTKLFRTTVTGCYPRPQQPVCCGNAYRKRAYTTRYQDLADAFRTAKVDQACLEHCTLSYDMMTLWDMWDDEIARSPRSNTFLRSGCC